MAPSLRILISRRTEAQQKETINRKIGTAGGGMSLPRRNGRAGLFAHRLTGNTAVWCAGPPLSLAARFVCLERGPGGG